MINQGDVYWVLFDAKNQLRSSIPHPHLIIQENILNHSHTPSLLICALTTNRKKAKSVGNVLLEIGEANLSKQSIVEVSKLSIIDKTQLGEYIGSLTQARIDQILAGLRFVQSMIHHHTDENNK